MGAPEMAAADEAAMVEALLQGDERAFEWLVEQHHTTLVSASSPRSRSASFSATATASLPCRRTSSIAASQILRSLVIIMLVNPDAPRSVPSRLLAG